MTKENKKIPVREQKHCRSNVMEIIVMIFILVFLEIVIVITLIQIIFVIK